MIYEEHPMPTDLAGIATRTWFLQAAPVRRFEKILPLPFVHIIVNLSDPYRLFDREGAAATVADAFVSGIQSEYLVIESPSLIRHVGIELTPAGLQAFAPETAGATGGAVQDARLILPGIDALVTRLRTTRTPSASCAELVSYLREHRSGDPDRVVSAAITALHSDPDVAVGEVAQRCGVSHRTLIARFRGATGMTPKRYAQVWRFHSFVNAVRDTGGAPDWAGLAPTAGYYDQPHVVRAFRRFSGWTPTQYHRLVTEHGPDAAHFVPLEHVPAQARS